MSRKRIMIVDDDPVVSRLVKVGLEKTGRYEVVVMSDGNRALAALRQQPVDLVLLDLMMPGMDGGEVAYRIKCDPVLSRLPVVFLTSLVTTTEARQTHAVSTGYRYLAKPTGPAQLMEVVEEELAKRWPVEPVAAPVAPPVPDARARTVLFADDDANLRGLLVSFLRLRGFRVLEASDGAAALLILSASRDTAPVDVLLADIEMPGMNGIELATRCAAESPQTRVMLMSGYAPPEEVAHQGQAGVPFLQKPFLPNSLAQAVEALLQLPPVA